MKKTILAFASLLALAAAPSDAEASRCYRYPAAPRMPFDPAFSMREYGVTYGDFGVTPPACSFGSAGLDVTGGALLAGAHDTPNLYGLLTAAVNVRATLALDDDFFISANVGLFQYREVHNATVVVPGASFGPIVLGAHFVAVRRHHFQITPYLRGMLYPATQYAVVLGIEPGTAAMFEFARRFTVHAGLSIPMSATQLDAASWNILLRGSVELSARVVDKLELSLGVDVRGRFLPSVAFDGVAPYLGMRVFPGRGTALQLTLSALNYGADNTLARFALGFWTSF